MLGATDESGPRYNSSAGNLPSLIRNVDFRHGSMEFPPHIDSGLFVFGPNCSGSVARPFIEICSLLQKFDRKFRLPANPFGEIKLHRPAAPGQLFHRSGKTINCLSIARYGRLPPPSGAQGTPHEVSLF